MWKQNNKPIDRMDRLQKKGVSQCSTIMKEPKNIQNIHHDGHIQEHEKLEK